ncbi:serine-type D-Ala-D-Ala carboxypeptidase [Dokdonia pacifica]|uniref:CubicO group peptidase, beta-lactamase class C family n=1 Tax=Dokdonia pacifica TaxID=1627892 RepID=A0A238YFM9_9FLAO|nr:serine hydrolase domain-containing protein [Dokdonia pacifica]GGG12614.1 serine-type D-Ala-D-Ala carboxypeptidase [Dokdonia pacifica]SNR69870.1 CubicO group peptidase, beta-lactamase class C family [Dokdonia pacifica]
MKKTKRKTTKAKQIFRIVLFVGTFISLWFVPWILVKAWIVPLPDTVQAQVDQTLSYGFDGVIVYVDEAGKPPAFYSAGYHNRELKIPANPNALFKIASISKLYVAVAITKLAHDNHVSLDKTVADYFPELVGRIENVDKITLRMMVQHRSGIPNFIDNPDFWKNQPNTNIDVLEYVLDVPADFEPNKDYGYSNTNYLLLSRIIEQVTGGSRQEYFKKEILIPLGLNNTFGSLDDVNLDDVMSGYYVGIEKDFKNENQGMMIATAEDVGIFLRALNDGTLLNESEMEIYTSMYEFNHGGLAPGYQSMTEYHKDIDAVVIQFMNTTDFEGYQWNLLQITHSRVVKILRKAKS